MEGNNDAGGGPIVGGEERERHVRGACKTNGGWMIGVDRRSAEAEAGGNGDELAAVGVGQREMEISAVVAARGGRIATGAEIGRQGAGILEQINGGILYGLAVGTEDPAGVIGPKGRGTEQSHDENEK